MELIKRTENRRSATKGMPIRHYGLFVCPYCKKIIEKRIDCGFNSKSCGCVNGKLIGESNTKHGDCGTRLHNIWIDMKQRCYNTNCCNYKNYGSRGISVFTEWRESYIKFKEWALKNGYKNTLQIDRKDNDGDYTPENCQFLTPIKNKRKTRKTKLSIEIANKIRSDYKTGKYTMRNLCEKYDYGSSGAICDIIHGKKWNPLL